MTTALRRDAILKTIKDSARPVSGSALAQATGVSRQVIVQDIAVLRAAGHAILATPAGYMMTPAAPVPFARVLTCRHNDMNGMRAELMAIVRSRAAVQDVIVEHPVYGEYRAMLMLSTESDVEIFLRRLSESPALPLSSLTEGVHLHTVAAADESRLDAVEAALAELGILCPDG